MQLDILIEAITGALVSVIIPATITNISTIRKNNLRLQKLSEYDGGTIANNNYILSKINGIQKENTENKKIEVILPYVKKLSTYISEEDLKVAYYNIANLKVLKNYLVLALGISGGYSVEKNMILYINGSSLGHEFLHMCSSVYDEQTKIELCGFYQRKFKASIGIGITEGYTELLASRLYNKNGRVGSYKSLVRLAEIFEFFFNNPKDIAHLYFNCNLPGLIKHLEQYASRQEVIKLIMDIDNIYAYEFALGNPLPLLKSIQAQIKLYNWFASKSQDLEKIKKLENLICQNKVISLIMNNKISLCKKNICTNSEDNKETPNRHK